jgi:spore coat polysaccharide biosynthesis protein SpsF
MVKVGIILQARMGSKRLPNKVMRLLRGKPMLYHCITRLNSVGDVYVATTNLERDTPIAELAEVEKVRCYRGSEKDVLGRYYETAKRNNIEVILRATADNPLVCPDEAKRVVQKIVNNNLDYVSGLHEIDGVGLPVGAGVEAMSFAALEESWQNGVEAHHREHVNEYILENQNRFQTVFMKCRLENSCPELHLTVDTEEDFARVDTVMKYFDKPVMDITIREVVGWYKQKMSQKR